MASYRGGCFLIEQDTEAGVRPGLGQGWRGQTAESEHQGEAVTLIGEHGLEIEIEMPGVQSKAQDCHTIADTQSPDMRGDLQSDCLGCPGSTC